MTQKIFSLIVGAVFALVALAHLLRIGQGWQITVAGALVPMWVSWVGLVVAIVFAYYGIRFGTSKSSIAP